MWSKKNKMGKRYYIKGDGGEILIHEMLWLDKRASRCQLCKKKLEGNQEVAFISSSEKFIFSNTWAHLECLSKVDKTKLGMLFDEDCKRSIELRRQAKHVWVNGE
jgi:hypothetical protein